MEEPDCVLLDESMFFKQEMITEEPALTDDTTVLKEEFISEESQWTQCLDKSDTMPQLHTKVEVNPKEFQHMSSNINIFGKIELTANDSHVNNIIKNEVTSREPNPASSCIYSVMKEELIIQEGSVYEEQFMEESDTMAQIHGKEKGNPKEFLHMPSNINIFGKIELTAHNSHVTNITKNEATLQEPKPVSSCIFPVMKEELIIQEGSKNEEQFMEEDNLSQTGFLMKEGVIQEDIRSDLSLKAFNCSKAYNQSSDLFRHTLVVKASQCDVCSQYFTDLSELSKHKLSVHSGHEKVQCDVCNKVISKGYLLKHKIIHSRVKAFQCDVCNKSFSQLQYLKYHELIHSAINKFQCQVCNKAFAHKCSLTSHMLLHTDKHEYYCDICNKAFALKKYLYDHKVIHSGVKRHQCDICNKAFTKKTYLYHHKLIHSSVKKHQCDICNKAFKSPCDLSSHKNIHSGVKKTKLVCYVCKKAFTKKATLLKHIFMHSS